MENKIVQEINAIRDELSGEINLRKLDNDDIVVSVGLGDDASQEKSRLVVKTLCKALDDYQVKNVTIKQKAYDNQDGWAPMIMVQKPNNTNIQMYTQVTPEQADEIIKNLANANEGVNK